MSFSNLGLLNKDFVWPVAAGSVIEVVEKKAGGAGVCRFRPSADSLFIKAKDQAPVVWALRNLKCAEAAFLTFEPSTGYRLHIVEMKSTVTISEFGKVIDQWRGMYLSALSILGVLKLPEPVEVTVYIAYKVSKIEDVDGTQTILQKTLVGGDQLPIRKEWYSAVVDLHHGVLAKIVKGTRSPDNVDFGVVL